MIQATPSGHQASGKVIGPQIPIGPMLALEAWSREYLVPFLPPLPVAAVIPAFCEAATIGRIVARARQHVDSVIVVDDGSRDATAALAARAGSEVVRLPRNRGKAGAVMAGLAAARARGYTAVVMLDADGQHLPEEIPGVLAPILSGEADMVVGSRFLEVHSEIPAYRVLGQKTLNLFTALGAGVSLTDTQSGFRALGPAALACLDFVSNGYSLESDMIAHFADCNLRITEVPISCRYDVPNTHKKNSILHGLGIVSAMTRAIFIRRSRVIRLAGVPLILTGSLLALAPYLLDPFGTGGSVPAASKIFALLVVFGVALVSGTLLFPSRQYHRVAARNTGDVDGDTAEIDHPSRNNMNGDLP